MPARNNRWAGRRGRPQNQAPRQRGDITVRRMGQRYYIFNNSGRPITIEPDGFIVLQILGTAQDRLGPKAYCRLVGPRASNQAQEDRQEDIDLDLVA